MSLGTPIPGPNADLPKRQSPRPSGYKAPAPGTPAPTTDPFKATPVFSGSARPSSGWQGETRPSGGGSYFTNVMNDSLDFWGAPTTRTQVNDTYTQQYGADAVQRAQLSGLDPDVYFNENLTDKARAIIDQWGTNLPNAPKIIEQQKTDYAREQDQYARDDAFMEEWDAWQAGQQTSRDRRFDTGSAMATSRYELGLDELNQGFGVDMGILGEQRLRNVDLQRSDNAADLGYLNTMRGITDAREGLRGERYGNEKDFFHQNWGELQTQKGTAYDRFMENDQYGRQQAVDNAAQYGFTGRQYEASVSDAFDQRNTQNRALASNAAATGSMSSAGFRDNRSDITGQYGSALTGAGLTMDRQNQQTDEQDRAIGHSRELNQLGYADTQSGFRGQENQLQYGLTQAGNAYNTDLQGFAATRAGYDKEGNRLANVGKSLESLGREYGLKGQDIENQFQSAVTKAGLDLNEVNLRLEQELNSGNAQAVMNANNFMQQLMAMQAG